MEQMMKISEAGSLALHGMVYLARGKSRLVQVKNLAQVLKASPYHLYKVLERLEKEGLLRAVRGPRGGYRLARDGSEITLLEVYQAIEGRLRDRECLFQKRICTGENCLMGGLLKKVNKEFRDYLTNTRVSDLKNLYPKAREGK